MTGIITPFQKFRENDYADIANVATLKHFLVPHGKQSLLVDYKAGVHHSAFFTGHDTAGKYSIPGTISPGTALTGGNWTDLSTNNFAALVVGYWDNATITIQYGDSATNGYINWSGAGGIKGAGGTASLSTSTNTGTVTGRTLIRSGTTDTRLEIDGAIVDSDSSTNVGAVTLDDDIGSLFLDRWYGSVIFQFSGALPSDFDTVLAKIITDFKNGVHRLPKAVEDWT